MEVQIVPIKTQQKFMVFLCVSVLAFGMAAKTAFPVLAVPSSAAKISGLDYHDQWLKLWEDHITWTRMVIMGILDDLPGTSAYVDRLLQNYTDMENALLPYYGEQAEVFGDLIKDHLVIAAELLTAALNGDTADFDDAKARWYENANLLVEQMNLMNPKFWPLEETRQMWIDHLDATLLEATTHLSGDFVGEVADYDQIHQMALEMADFISRGVVTQFPEKFTGSIH